MLLLLKILKMVLQIRTFEGNFSNIDNGIGIFGAVFTKRKPIIFNKLFLRSIGYSTN